jgi:hypothetical protein
MNNSQLPRLQGNWKGEAMSSQQLFAQEPQKPFGFAEDEQPTMEFPLSLAEKYQPRKLDELVGLAQPLRLFNALVEAPRPCAMLLVGKPGVGKTIAGLCFADTLGASLVHISSQKCDVATLDSLRDRFAYHPPKGNFWVCLIDEADQMSEKAQVQFLSRLDATASLVVGMGGAAVRKSQPPIIWIFTANGTGPKGTVPPTSLEKRFLSRCMVIPFDTLSEPDLAVYLRSIWSKETDLDAQPEYFDYLARRGGIREALTKMQVDILCGAPRPIEAQELPPSLPRNYPVITKLPPIARAPLDPRTSKWRRVYAGRADERIQRIEALLAANKVETFVRDVRTANAPHLPRASVLVSPESFARAMKLLAAQKER